MIVVKSLCRDFKRYKHKPGLKGVLQGLVHREQETVHAVRDVSFHIQSGEFIGYIGPNGAGKSTTIKMLTGILTPTSGSVAVDGVDPVRFRKENAQNIGTVFGQRSQLWWDLPIMDTYVLLRHMYKLDEKAFDLRIDLLKELLNLGEFWDAPVRQLSLGQRMRGELGAALIHSPKLLFLDEPTIGMDVLVKEQIKTFLTRINREQGVTVLLTTHDLKDVEDLCPRAILINKGTVLFDGALSDMRQRSEAKTRIELDMDRELRDEEMGAIRPALEQLGIELAQHHGRRVAARFLHGKHTPMQIIDCLSRDATVLDIRITEPPIEEIIADYYR